MAANVKTLFLFTLITNSQYISGQSGKILQQGAFWMLSVLLSVFCSFVFCIGVGVISAAPSTKKNHQGTRERAPGYKPATTSGQRFSPPLRSRKQSAPCIGRVHNKLPDEKLCLFALRQHHHPPGKRCRSR